MLEFPVINVAIIESGSSRVVLEVHENEKNAVARPSGGALLEADAVEIWIARWLRIRRKDLMAQYGCNSTRLYEIWWGERFPASREKAAKIFRERYPGLVEGTAFGYRRIRRKPVAETAVQASFDFQR